MLVYAGLFLSEDAGVQKILKDKASRGRAGADPARATRTARSWPTAGTTRASATRMAAKIRNALALYRPLRQVEGVEFRFHRTVLVQLDLPRR